MYRLSPNHGFNYKTQLFMIFINISSDQVHIADANKEIFLHRNDIEHTLGPALIDWHKKSPFRSEEHTSELQSH